MAESRNVISRHPPSSASETVNHGSSVPSELSVRCIRTSEGTSKSAGVATAFLPGRMRCVNRVRPFFPSLGFPAPCT